MSTTAVSLRENRVVSFWRSTNGKKVVMAVTGAILFLFVIGHMLGNLQVFEGPEKLNAYGAFSAQPRRVCCGRCASCSSPQ